MLKAGLKNAINSYISNNCGNTLKGSKDQKNAVLNNSMSKFRRSMAKCHSLSGIIVNKSYNYNGYSQVSAKKKGLVDLKSVQ